ncbi:MAG: HAD family hydrolase, partial [Actinomycetota bacterium]|nr:HAD family hydrolase [Actinomycetota bacterium]
MKVLSLDVFDTLLWRVVPEPVDAFLLVGRALEAEGHLRVPPEGFARLREAAEVEARATSVQERSTPEVSLPEIYACLRGAVTGDVAPARLADVEVEVERSLTFPDLAVVDLARSLKASLGVRVAVVSDTYFSAAQLHRLLDREPFVAMGIEAVFTSSDKRRNKGSGLYDVVLSSLGVAPGDVLHLGDHPEADVACAARKGIHSVRLDRRPEPLPEVLAREGLSRGDALRRSRAPLAGGAGDFGLTALRAKALRRCDGASLPEELRPWWATGVTVFGPVFTAFAEWVHERAAAAGAGEVFCVMREGAFLAPLVEAARRQPGAGARASTLWVSRHVCTQAAVVEASTAELEAFLHRRQAPTLALACEGLGLAPAELPGLADRAGDRLDDEALRRRFLRAVAGSGELRARVSAHCSTVRRRLVDHVVRAVGRSSGPVVLVDLGWGATIQAALDVALRAEGVELRTLGLYLITNEAAVGRMLDGVAAEGFLGTVGLPDPAIRWIMRSPEVLEQVCMPEVGSLQGFDDRGEPVTAPAAPGRPDQREQRRAVQDGVLAFQQEWGRYRDVVPAEHHALSGAAQPLLRTMLLRFVVEPTIEEATMFGSWLHDENWGSGASEAVLSTALAESLAYLTPRQLLDLPMDRLYWPFGLAAVHNPPLARAAAAVAFGELPADLFNSGQDTRITLYVDYGAGLVPRRQTPVSLNSRGLGYVRERVAAHPLRAVGIGFPSGPGLVRLDWMRLRFGMRGRSEPVVVEVRWPEGAAALRYHDAVVLSPNLLFGPRRAPRVSYECPESWGLDVYSVEIEVGFGWLASEPGAAPRRDRAAVALALARRARPRARKVLQLGR